MDIKRAENLAKVRGTGSASKLDNQSGVSLTGANLKTAPKKKNTQ